MNCVAFGTLMVIDAPPRTGPKLHKHPYEEVFVVQEGEATFTAGDDVIEARGGQVVVPAGVSHKFVNFGRSIYTRANGSSQNGSKTDKDERRRYLRRLGEENICQDG